MNVTDASGSRPDERARGLAGLYDASYYATHLGAPYRWGEGTWEEFFGGIADAIVAELAPKTVLDAGCGIGFLVDALRKRGVEAYGLDISEYAISQAPEEIRPFCTVASVTEELDRGYDVIACIEVLEHLPADLVERAIDNLARHTEQILFSSTPTDLAEPTHYGVRPMEEWIELFAGRGFFRNVDLDASFVAPHAVHLVRSQDTVAAVARDYERWYWRHRDRLERALAQADNAGESWREEAQLAAAELAEWDAFRGRSGYRIFLRLARLRGRLAPGGTTRDRVVRTSLRRVANLADPRRARVRRGAPNALRAILFISACPGDTRRYRCDHQAAQLALGGVTVDIAEHSEVDFDRELGRYAAFVLHRVPWSRHLDRFLVQAREQGKPVLFDTDDLVFDPEARKHVAALVEMDESEQALYVQGLRRFQHTMRACDGVLVSTQPLREAATQFHERVEVAYNAVSEEMVQQADAAVAEREREPRDADRATLGYFSGTHTHNVDFLEAADAVLWALDTYRHVSFLAVGRLSLDPRFDAYGERVRRLPLQPWQRLPGLLAQTDVNLAPLEPRNPFTECKSCLKYIEGGLVGTPTIASARSDFVRAIDHGRNGFLADSPEDWRAAIQALVESPERRRVTGREAFDDVRRNHTVGARSKQLIESVATLARRDDGAPLTVNWVLGASSSGERTVFDLADYLAGQGHAVRIYIEANSAPLAERQASPVRAQVYVGHDAIAPADATIATDAPTARIVAAHEQSLFKLYFVQSGGEAPDADQADALPLRRVSYALDVADATSNAAWRRPGEQLEHILRETCFLRLREPAS